MTERELCTMAHRLYKLDCFLAHEKPLKIFDFKKSIFITNKKHYLQRLIEIKKRELAELEKELKGE